MNGADIIAAFERAKQLALEQQNGTLSTSTVPVVPKPSKPATPEVKPPVLERKNSSGGQA
jgi:hypothetical protein